METYSAEELKTYSAEELKTDSAKKLDTYPAEECHNITTDGSYNNTEIKIRVYNDKTEDYELFDVTEYIYKLDPFNIKDGDYIYVVRESEPNDVWVFYTPVGAFGRALYEYKDEDDDFSNAFMHHNCLAIPNETVIMAGELIVRKPIIYVNCTSGHYKPAPNKIGIILKLLYDKFNSDYTVKYYDDCYVPFEHRSSTYATTALTFTPSKNSVGRKRKTPKRIYKKRRATRRR